MSQRGPVIGRLVLVVACFGVVLSACGETPLESLGLRSSDWINEPTVPTTIAVNTTTPTVASADDLIWVNDEIVGPSGNQDAVLAAVFARREGDRFIQASRGEIAIALPDVAFPSRVPAGAGWVSSQLVFDNDGSVAADPSAAFGIWSAEPYTRSRSVAQMVVLRVSMDLEAATELATGEVAASCARFSERTTDSCELTTVGGRDTWLLTESNGVTVVWYEGPYRYELYGRPIVPVPVLVDMSADVVPLGSVGVES